MNEEIQRTIDTITRLEKEGAELDELKAEIHKLLSVAPRSVASIYEPGVMLYRATKHHQSVPSHIEQIWYPPPEKTRWNRANRPKDGLCILPNQPVRFSRRLGVLMGYLNNTAPL